MRGHLFFILFTLICIFAGAAHAANKLQFHPAGQDRYIAELKMSEEASEQDALAIMAFAAAKICGDKKVNLGEYSFKGTEILDKQDSASASASASDEAAFEMRQHLQCGDRTAVAASSVPPPSAAEIKQFELRARQATKTYLGYLAQRDFEKAYSMFSADLSTSVGYESWLQTKGQPAANAGELLRGDIYKVSTYVNPPSAPQGGIFIATDFDFEYQSFPVFCGYLVWQVEGAELKVIREDIGKITAEQIGTMDAQKVDAAKSAFRCKP